ncbi:N-acetylmuramoyl-L-alanine amidase [Streptomyces viridochromogenes]|uniref:N-acetylmuramoyl-L-alanine amidase n=1 Tax=Streptomyces viridochromogenes TaxID=1938 RepID=UPI00069F5B92|nr:N-acetylmuramoyl-L-alanine amidase [Streptomyces viridochromogenes]KOG21815.1 peptidoglycan-binding protein [Streptomyces viridochromogenes]
MATPLTAEQMLTKLTAEGLTVHEYPGWKTHNRDDETGKAFGPVVGVLIHHTAGRNDKDLCYRGRTGLPGPLSHAWLGKTAGLWLLGNGRANHAGLVDLDVVNALRAEVSPLPKDDQANTDGNDCLYGLEIENLGDGQDPYPVEQYRRAVLWAAALCRAHGWSERSVAGHKEVQPGKIDPSFDMDVFRADVRAQLAKGPTVVVTAPKPTPSRPRVDLSRLVAAARKDPGAAQGHVTYMAGTNLVEAALVKEGLLGRRYAGDGSFGSLTRDAYAKWQRRLGYSGSAADGIPGMTSLKKLGAKHGFDVVA